MKHECKQGDWTIRLFERKDRGTYGLYVRKRQGRDTAGKIIADVKRISLKTQDKAGAVDAFNEARRQLREDGHLTEYFGPPLTDYIRRFLIALESTRSKNTYRCHSVNLKRFSEFLELKDIKEITPGVYDEYIAYRKGIGRAIASINSELRSVGSLMGYLKRMGLISKPVRPKLLRAATSKAPRYWTDEEIERVLSEAIKSKHSEDYLYGHDWAYEMLILALNTGLRFGELCYLTWGDIYFRDFDSMKEKKDTAENYLLVREKTIHCPSTHKGESIITWKPKDYEVRRIPLPDEAVKILKEILEGKRRSRSSMDYQFKKRELNYAFIQMDKMRKKTPGNAIVEKEFEDLKKEWEAHIVMNSSQWVFPGFYDETFPVGDYYAKVLRNILKKAGVYKKGDGWHTARHTYATKLAASGTPLPWIKELLGHADIKTTMVYVHVANASLDKAVKGIKFTPKRGKKEERNGAQYGAKIVNLDVERMKKDGIL